MRALAIIAAAGLLAGCTTTSSPSPAASATPSPAAPSPSPTAATIVLDHVGRLWIRHPAAWVLLMGRVDGGAAVPPYYLSNQPFTKPACATPGPGQALGGCSAPLDRLADDGVLVTITMTVEHFPPPAPPPPKVKPPDGACLAIGGTQEVTGSSFPFDVTACLRGPDLATSIAEVEAVIGSIAFG